MATKKECDRCNKQWNIADISETCAIAIDVPAKKWDRFTPNEQEVKIAETFELCQDCARKVYAVLTAKDDIDKPA